VSLGWCKQGTSPEDSTLIYLTDLHSTSTIIKAINRTSLRQQFCGIKACFDTFDTRTSKRIMGYHVLIVRHGRLGGFLVQAMANAVKCLDGRIFGFPEAQTEFQKQLMFDKHC